MPKNKSLFFLFISMGIAKAQAALLAEGLLNDLGSDKDGLQPRETLSELYLLAGELIESAQENLNSSQSNATGDLSSSLVVDDPVNNGTVVRMDILMNYYGRFVNKGVKGRKSGKGLYAFKYDNPSAKMVTAIAAWMKEAGLKVSNTNTAKTTSKNEKKNSAISELSGAYAVTQSVINKGIKPTGFMDKAIIATQQKVRQRLGAALKIDIINAINQ